MIDGNFKESIEVNRGISYYCKSKKKPIKLKSFLIYKLI